MPKTVFQSVNLPSSPSILVLTFWPEGQGTRVELTQANVPARLYETLVSGWPTRYWDPWRTFLEKSR
jgi:hypothetical protein